MLPKTGWMLYTLIAAAPGGKKKFTFPSGIEVTAEVVSTRGANTIYNGPVVYQVFVKAAGSAYSVLTLTTAKAEEVLELLRRHDRG